MFGKSKVDDIAEKQRKAAEREKQEIDSIKLVCKEIFKGPNGIYFLMFLKKLCGWNDLDNNINSDILIYKKARRDIWLCIRNLLPKDILAQVEIYREYKIDE